MKPETGSRKFFFYGFFFIICFFLFSFFAFSQSTLRTKIIIAPEDTIVLDTLSIIPGTVTVKRKNELADSSYYKIDYGKALLIFHDKSQDTIIISYKVFPLLLSKTYSHKDISKIQSNAFGNTYVYTYDKKNEVDFFKTEGLSKSGSISRGLSFGNNQDVVLNSNLNLQLAGKLSENMDLLLAATDQNIPVQPEGNTQQLQEFDKVFIQLGILDLPAKGKTILTAGDFQAVAPKGYFMNFNKKLQGLSIETTTPLQHGVLFSTKISAAVSKGKFARNNSAESSNGNTFNGQKQERNQGPYKLRGAENEQFIIVLAGTEKIFLDGQLLERGQENDYIIDYNTAEIIFTPKNLITKDKRIGAEFQYSDKNYARSLIHTGADYENKKIKVHVNLFSEQDNKNRSLQQELSDPQKLLLASIGDTLQNALWHSADSVAFNGTEVLYEKRDDTIGTFIFKDVYRYSTDSAKAHYRLSFSFVGANKGNYKLKQSAANGKTYEWVMPDTITGQLRGSYEPVILLIAPKQKQMVTAGMDYSLSKNSKLIMEGAMTKNDINTFSSHDKADDEGFAGKISWENKIPLRKNAADTGQSIRTWNLLTDIHYEYIQKNFSPIERYRNVEFERDWNRGNSAMASDQNMIGGRIGVAKKENIVAYDYKSFLEGSFYNGQRHGGIINLGAKGFVLSADGSYLDSKSELNNTDFLRHRTMLARDFKIKKSKLRIGVKEKAEENLIRHKIIDSLLAGSARFYEREPFIEFSDSAGNKYTVHYKQRMDYGRSGMKGGELHRSTFAENYGASIDVINNPNSQFRFSGSYRKLEIVDPGITIQKPENTVIGRVEYNFSLLKGFFTSGTFYEAGSGLEVKRDFIFLEVPPGQGTHIWKDYNNNGIKELNEFEISSFPNEANYIKVWTPADDYISAYTNQFSEVFSIKPAAKWSGKRGIKKLVSRFHNQTAFRADRKTTNTDLAAAYNPFLSDTKDPTLVTLNSSLRNTVFFNQSNPVFGMDFTWQDIRNKTLLENDTSSRTNTFYETKTRWNLNRQWTVQGMYKTGAKENNSKFFLARNYRITYFEAEPKISVQPGSSFRLSVSYNYSEKKNILASAPAKALVQNLGNELRYSALNKGSLSAKGNFILIAYNEAENSPLAYEMLEGLKPGQNYTWSIGYSRTLAGNIQLTLSYDGRQSPGIKTIHTGNAQVRAFF